MLGILLSIAVLCLAGYMIFKQYKPQVVLTLCGFILILCGYYFTGGSLGLKQSSGVIFIDIYEYVKNVMSSRAAGLGLSIMAVGGYAKYMEKMGASRAMVDLLTRPLKLIKSPYIILSATFILGQVVAQFITSASGLGMLLMVTLYPTLVFLGVSRLSAVAVIGSTMAVEWGILHTTSVFAAGVAGITVDDYFMNYQLKVGIAVIIAVAIAHFFIQKWMDKKDGVETGVKIEQKNLEDLPPIYYAILPTLPLILTVLSLILKSYKYLPFSFNLVVVMLMSLTITFIVEAIRRCNIKDCMNDIQQFFDGMGTQFANVVTLIVGGEVFAKGLMVVGSVDTVIKASTNLGIGGIGIMIIMVLVVAGCAIVMGSGNAPFMSFANLVPDIAKGLSVPAVAIILPMHFATSIARSMSPITAVIVVTAGIAEISPFKVAKRTALPMVIGLAVNIIASAIFFF